MITIGMDPNLITIGGFVLSWHGLMTAIGVIVGVLIPVRMSKAFGLAEDDIYSVALWAIPGGIIGARLFHVVDNLDIYMQNPAAILNFQGMAIYGGILGGAVTGIGYAVIRKMKIGHLADVSAFGLIVAMMIGRIGCLINGDAWGSPTTLPWGIVYTHPGAFAPLNVAGHPAPIYEILWDLVVLGVIWRFRRMPHPNGSIFLVFAATYAVGRFFISFFRENLIWFGGLQESQLISIAVFVGSMLLLSRLYATYKPQAPIFTEEEPEPVKPVIPAKDENVGEIV